MNFSTVYTLVSTIDDIYTEQLYISSLTLKNRNDMRTVVITDQNTNNSFHGSRLKLLKYIDDLIVVNLDSKLSKKTRSRILKTSAMQYINEDIVLLDTDTMILGSFQPLNSIEAEIAAVSDLNSPTFSQSPCYDKNVIESKNIFNYPIENEDKYYNTGFILAKHTESVNRFFHLWNRAYIESESKGLNYDQPAFAYVNYMQNHLVSEIGPEWNCQIDSCDYNQFRKANVLHYFNNNNITYLNNTESFVELKRTGELDNRLENILADPFSMFTQSPIMIKGADIQFAKSNTYKLAKYIYNSGIGAVVEHLSLKGRTLLHTKKYK